MSCLVGITLPAFNEDRVGSGLPFRLASRRLGRFGEQVVGHRAQVAVEVAAERVTKDCPQVLGELVDEGRDASRRPMPCR